MLKLVHLDALAARYPRELSGGQRQRVAIARALVIEPPVLLLDEPLSNLDAKLREEMQFELRRIQRKVGTTTIMVTHDQAEALSISDRVVVMEAGRATQVDAPLPALRAPEERVHLRLRRQDQPAAGHASRAARRGAEAVLGAGPAACEVDAGDFADGARRHCLPAPREAASPPRRAARLDGRVEERFFLGSQWLYRVEHAARRARGERRQRRQRRAGRGAGAPCTSPGPDDVRAAAPADERHEQRHDQRRTSRAGRRTLLQPARRSLLFAADGAAAAGADRACCRSSVYDADDGRAGGGFTLAHYAHVLGDSYYYEIFWRTGWIAALVDADLRARRRARGLHPQRACASPWRSIFLLVILAPLLVSVVVRAFGWSMLLGPNGLVNQVLRLLGIGAGEDALHDDRGGRRAGARDAAVHGDPGLDLAAEARPDGRERRAVAEGLARSPRCAASCCRRSRRACSRAA